jgi:thiosulfate dehydrogenase [quinone] large subunit
VTSGAPRRPGGGPDHYGGPPPPPPADGSIWDLRGPGGTIAPGWYLVPLRLFLGATFLFAGLQKLANPDFFRSSSPISIHAQMLGASHTSPIGGLLGHLVGAAPLFGLVIALGEVAVGVGALLGLLTRVAAVGGMAIAFSLFLAISFHTAPYYLGSDIVFVFAWTPLALAGAAGAPAVDTWMARRATRDAGTDTLPRPGAVSRGAVIGLVAGGTAVLVGAVALMGRIIAPATTTDSAGSLSGGGSPAGTGPASTTTPPASTTGAPGGVATTTAPKPKGTDIGSASSVPVGGSATFTDPSTGDPSLVIQHDAGHFVAFDAICPHAGCTVAYQSGADIIACPCHGSEFNPANGDVVQGPATYGLTPIKVILGSDGNLYVV